MLGFELLYSTIKSNLKSKNDLLVAVIHLQCINNGFVCVGTGEEFPETPENGSELLPNGWNQTDETYILRYFNPKTKQKLLIKAIKLNELLLMSALVIGNNTASSHHFKTEDYISNDFQTFESAFTSGSVESVSEVMEKEIIEKTLGRKSTEIATNTNTNRNTNERTPEIDPLRVGQPRILDPYAGGVGYDPLQGGQWPPPIGGADLDPFGRGQGGMFMDPRHFPNIGRGRNPAPGLPRGAVPPGARFDPFGPPGVGPDPRNPNRNPRHMGPDPDHLPPPGYDDMFM